MDFKKNILIVDLETTGLDYAKHEIIQIAAIILDHKSLKELKAFSTYVKPKKWTNRDPESMAVNRISKDQLTNAPTLKEAIKEFTSFVDTPVIFSNYGGVLDNVFLQAAYKKLGLPYPFDYHPLNIWSLALVYMTSKNKLTNRKKFTGFSMEDILRHFKLPIENRHDALADCRFEAEILRKIITEKFR